MNKTEHMQFSHITKYFYFDFFQPFKNEKAFLACGPYKDGGWAGFGPQAVIYQLHMGLAHKACASWLCWFLQFFSQVGAPVLGCCILTSSRFRVLNESQTRVTPDPELGSRSKPGTPLRI